MIQDALRMVMDGEDLSQEQAYQVMANIMDGDATPSQISAFLVAAKLKGETHTEVTGFATAMREKCYEVQTRHENAIDMCGTGGDGTGTFNISTLASFVVAAAGVPVAKHGNRSVSSRCGSADLLENLGVNISLTPEQAGACLDEIDITFLFAPAFHPAMKHAVKPRREIGVRTVFNLLGPITNPARVKRQVMGVYHPGVRRLVAEVFRDLGAEHVLVLHSEDGLDEVSNRKSTYALELRKGQISEIEITPEQFGYEPAELNGYTGGTPEENARMTRALLSGKNSTQQDIVVMNAACGLVVGGAAKTYREGAEMAADAINSGAALKKLDALIEVSQSV